jgi:penicillin-binding protein 1C
MQLSRLRWGLRTRSPWGKSEQIFRAILLERHYSKEEIAAAYFTIAPYGGNVEGARAASFRWCGKDASELTLREAASLSAIPQSPGTRRPRTGGNPLLAAAQARLMTRLRANHGEPPNELDAEFHLVPTAIPREAPHLARRRLHEDPGSLTVPSAIDLRQQHVVELSIREFLDRWYAQGLRNASAILLHAPSGEIRASVGSADFHDARIAGQIDGTRARRSPGSTLKPFIYALALDAGLIQPQTLLDDAPRRFAGYNPENSDRQFLGPIAASDALRRSRNVPAIELASRLP